MTGITIEKSAKVEESTGRTSPFVSGTATEAVPIKVASSTEFVVDAV